MLNKKDYGIVNSYEGAISLAQGKANLVGKALCRKRTLVIKLHRAQRGAIHADNKVIRSYMSVIMRATELVLLRKLGRNKVCLSTNSAISDAGRRQIWITPNKQQAQFGAETALCRNCEAVQLNPEILLQTIDCVLSDLSDLSAFTDLSDLLTVLSIVENRISPKGFIFITAGRDPRKTVARIPQVSDPRKTLASLPLPARQDCVFKSCLSGSFILRRFRRSLTCGYENPAFQAVSRVLPALPHAIDYRAFSLSSLCLAGRQFSRTSYAPPKTSFLPNFNNKTTSVAQKSHMQLPHYLIYGIQNKQDITDYKVQLLYVINFSSLYTHFISTTLNRTFNKVCLSANSATSGVSSPANPKILKILFQTKKDNNYNEKYITVIKDEKCKI